MDRRLGRAQNDSTTCTGEPVATVTSPHCAILFNRMLGQLHHCLQTGQHFDQEAAYPEYFSPTAFEAIDLDGTANPIEKRS